MHSSNQRIQHVDPPRTYPGLYSIRMVVINVFVEESREEPKYDDVAFMREYFIEKYQEYFGNIVPSLRLISRRLQETWPFEEA